MFVSHKRYHAETYNALAKTSSMGIFEGGRPKVSMVQTPKGFTTFTSSCLKRAKANFTSGTNIPMCAKPQFRRVLFSEDSV